ncbi:hypothetical protein TYRP_020614 [Tyrophagus putrescentiae]|nr:hypothetical protein TYRP_020614 [Tyrophagus putrescentiae]
MNQMRSLDSSCFIIIFRVILGTRHLRCLLLSCQTATTTTTTTTLSTSLTIVENLLRQAEADAVHVLRRGDLPHVVHLLDVLQRQRRANKLPPIEVAAADQAGQLVRPHIAHQRLVGGGVEVVRQDADLLVAGRRQGKRPHAGKDVVEAVDAGEQAVGDAAALRTQPRIPVHLGKVKGEAELRFGGGDHGGRRLAPLHRQHLEGKVAVGAVDAVHLVDHHPTAVDLVEEDLES